MRLRVLNLDLFGHFAGKSYDFGTAGPDTPDFHIIYGPNEAGKTTTMEAYLRLLYGFDAREAYDFQHQRKNLQVSGCFETAQGDLSLTRLPTRAASLTDAHGAPLPEAAIAAHLGGLGADDYRNLLCLDDDTIERGGEEIANSKGDIGRLLFSAAAGVSDLTAVLDSVDTQANALFLKRSSKTQMAQLKKELAEVTAQIKAQDVPASAYRKLRHTLATASELETQISAKRAALMGQLAQWNAQKAALPLLHKLDQIDVVLTALPDTPTSLDVAPDDLVQLLTAQHKANSDITRLTNERDDHCAELAQIDPPADHGGLLQRLHDLDEPRSRYATAQLDLPRRIETRDTVLRDMQRAAAELGATCDPVQLVVSPAVLAALETARDKARATAHDLASATAELARLTDKVTAAQDSFARTDAPNGNPIGDILDRFAVDTFAPIYATAKQSTGMAQRDLAAALAALTINGQVFTTVPTSANAATEIADLVQVHAELHRKITQTADEIDVLCADAAAQDAQIDAVRSASSLVDDAAAIAATTQRDTAWQAHRAALSVATADAFEAALRRTDEIATTRLTQAKDLGQLRQLLQHSAETAARITQLKQRQSRLSTEQTAVGARVTTIANDMGLSEAPSPTAFAQWAQRVATAEHLAQQLALTEQDHAATCDRANRLLAALGQHITLDTPDFDTMITIARQQAKAARDVAESHNVAQRAFVDLTADYKRQQAQHVTMEQTAQTAQRDWETLVFESLQNRVPADRLALSFDPLRSLREFDARHSTAARQVATMQEDQALFSTAVQGLAAQYGIKDDDPIATFTALRDLSDHAQAQEKLISSLTQQISDTADNIAQAQRDLDDIARQVANLGAQFPPDVPTQTVDDLRRAVADAHAAIAARKEKSDIESQIITHLGTADIAGARTVLDGQSTTAIATALMQVQDELDASEAPYRDASAARGAAARDLNAVTGDDSIAILAERKATLGLALQDAALRYVSLRAGHMLAQEAIRRYRDKHRSGMMEATQKAFSELTNGAYTALQTQAQGNSESLIAIDASGRAKHAQDMSKGTRFQLYLALRAAAYEQLADQGTCLPFFCDDIFETFDEARTKSACKMMARIGRRGQAIYLTHHQHVVDIARATCGDTVRVHEI